MVVLSDYADYVRGIENPDPLKVLRGWHNYRTGKYEPGALSSAEVATDLFPQNQERFKQYERYLSTPGFTPLRASLAVLLEARFDYFVRVNDDYRHDATDTSDSDMDAWAAETLDALKAAEKR